MQFPYTIVREIACQTLEDMESVTKKIQSSWRKIVLIKPNAKTAKWTILPFKKSWKGNIEDITFLEARKIVESCMKVNTYANVAQKVSPDSSSSTGQNFKISSLWISLLKYEEQKNEKLFHVVEIMINIENIEWNFRIQHKSLIELFSLQLWVNSRAD